jgi:hypothetical protein
VKETYPNLATAKIASIELNLPAGGPLIEQQLQQLLLLLEAIFNYVIEVPGLQAQVQAMQATQDQIQATIINTRIISYNRQNVDAQLHALHKYVSFLLLCHPWNSIFNFPRLQGTATIWPLLYRDMVPSLLIITLMPTLAMFMVIGILTFIPISMW